MIPRKIQKLTALFGVLTVTSMMLAASSGWAEAPAKPDQASVADVRKLLHTMEATAQMKKMIPEVNRQIWQAILGKGLGIPDELRMEISQEMSRQMMAMVPQFIEVVIPIYRRHLTAPEVKAAISFYSSPLGRSVAQKMAQINVDSFQAGAMVGRRMGEKAAETAIQRLRDKGYQL